MQRSSSPPLGVLAPILLGMLLTTVGGRLDGFLGGAAQGAGVVLLISGAWMFGALWRRPDGPDASWLPSRDGDR